MTTTSHPLIAGARAALLSGIVAAGAFAAPDAFAQVGPTVENPWQQGRAFYGDENFTEARRYIIEAIQREPNVPIYYLGLARTEYWLGHFDNAVYYYDVYLVDLAQQIPSDVREADMPSRVRGEREAANSARAMPTATPQAPQASTAARAAFDARVTEGPILTSTGGGAVAMYEAMLRAGYANPDLIEVKERLATALLREAGEVVGDHDAALPVLSLAQWQTQQERLDRWLSLTPDVAAATNGIPPSAMDPAVASTLNRRARVRAHVALCGAQIQYLNQNYSQAAEGFRSAFELLPDFVPAHMGRLNALVRLGNASETAEPEILRLENQLQRHAPDSAGLADVYRAAFAAQRGDGEGAARALGTLLGIPTP